MDNNTWFIIGTVCSIFSLPGVLIFEYIRQTKRMKEWDTYDKAQKDHEL